MGWPERLDAMERCVTVAQRLARGEGVSAVEAGMLPPADGPIPSALVPRAVSILTATRAAEAAVGEALAQAGTRLQVLRRSARPSDPEQRAGPAYVDTRA